MDRYDFETVGAMLAGSIAIALNLVFLQADAAVGAGLGSLVLIPIFSGLAIAASGLAAHIRRRGRDMVLVDRLCTGVVAYLALSAACSVLFQPRLD